MPTASLTFSLPDERVEHAQAVHAQDLIRALDEVARLARDALKYGPATVEVYEAALTAIREEVGGALALVE